MCRFDDTAVLNCAPILSFGMSLLNRSFAVDRKQLQFSQCIACQARVSAWFSYFHLISLVEYFTFNAI